MSRMREIAPVGLVSLLALFCGDRAWRDRQGLRALPVFILDAILWEKSIAVKIKIWETIRKLRIVYLAK